MSLPDGAANTGLQPERTYLSWQRTVLAIGAGGLLLGRSLFQNLPWLGIATGIASLIFVVTAVVSLHRRHRSRLQALSSGGWLLLAIALATGLGGVAALGVLLTR